MQTDYNSYLTEAFAGMVVNSYQPRDILSRAVEETDGIDFGYGVVKGTDKTKQVSLPHSEVITLTLNADLITGNKVNGSINGEAITEVDFDTDHATTMTALAAAIAALDGVTASVTAARVITVVVANQDGLAEDFLVTAGVSQATITPTYSTADIFAGVMVHEHVMARSTVDGSEVAKYFNKHAANVLDEGIIWVPVTEAVAVDDTAYVIATGSNRGKFSKTSAVTSISTTGKFKSATAGAGLAQLKIRLL